MGSQSIPKFHGSARSYPAFKLFWDQIVGRDCAESTQNVYLLDVMSPEVKNRISTVMRDCREIWDQLDNIYGKEDTLGEMVARELFDIKVSNCGGDYIIKLSTILEEIVLARPENGG